MVQTISSLLCEPIPFHDPLLKITLNITINKDGAYAFSKFSTDKGDFISVNTNPRVIIRYTPRDIPWEPNHQIVITQRNIFSLRLAFKKFYQNFQREDLYRYDERGRIKELLSTESDIVIVPLTNGQLMKLEPTVVIDNKRNIYPGVQITINKDSNQIPVTIDEFESIYDLIQSINIHQSGMILLQTYIGMKKISVESTMESLQSRESQKTTNDYQTRKNIFDREPVTINEEGIVSGVVIPKKPSSLDDL